MTSKPNPVIFIRGLWIPRQRVARRIAVRRNREFFRAPLTGIVCMHCELAFVDSLGVGMFLQTFLLALTARGIGSCVQVSIAGYPNPDFPANALSVAAQCARGQRHVRRGLTVEGKCGHEPPSRVASNS